MFQAIYNNDFLFNLSQLRSADKVDRKEAMEELKAMAFGLFVLPSRRKELLAAFWAKYDKESWPSHPGHIPGEMEPLLRLVRTAMEKRWLTAYSMATFIEMDRRVAS